MVLTLLNLTLGAAAAAQIAGLAGPLAGEMRPRNGLAIQANFTYGSGGTSADVYVQTSLDGGLTWIDIANFHFTTASAKAVANLSARTPVTTEYTPTDGSLAANTVKDGILGDWLRVKWTSVGTYVGTTFSVTAVPN